MNTRRYDGYDGGFPGLGVLSAPSATLTDDSFRNPFYIGSRVKRENDAAGQREQMAIQQRYGPVVHPHHSAAAKDPLTNSWIESVRNSTDVPRCEPADQIGLDENIDQIGLDENIDTYDSMDDLYDLECTQHSFDVPRAVPALQVRQGIPPLMPEAPMTPVATREDLPVTSGSNEDLCRMCGDCMHLPNGSRERIVIHDMGRLHEGESFGASTMSGTPPVPPLRYPRDRDLEERERYATESYAQSSMSGNSRSWHKQSFHAEYEMFDRRRNNLSKDSRNSLSFVGSLARVWSVNPNQKGSKAYHLTEVGNSEAGSVLCPWESEVVSDLGSVSGVMSREVSGALDSVIIDSAVLESTDYIGSDLNVCSTFRSIAEDPREDHFMASVREALRNAQLERRQGSNTNTDMSHQSWVAPPGFARSLRETHMAPENNRSLVPRMAMQLQQPPPRRFPLPIPCSSTAVQEQKETTRLPNLVARLGRSLSLKGRKAKSPRTPEGKKHKPFRGLRKAFSKASKALTGRKSMDKTPKTNQNDTHHVLEPPPRMIPLPSTRDSYQIPRIQSTWGSWRGNMPEPGAEDGPLTGRSLNSTFQYLTEVSANPLHSRNMYQDAQQTRTYVSTVSMEPPTMHEVHDGVDMPYSNNYEEENVYIDPYGLFERARADLAPAAIPTEVEAMEGCWVVDRSRSDKVDKMCEVLEFNHIMTKFWKKVSTIEIKVLNGRFRTIMKVNGVHEKVEEVPLNGEEIYVPRSDLANGKMNLSASLPTRGFLTFATWPNPRAGCREEHYRMEDNNQTLCIDMHFERRSGRACTVKWCFKRSK